MKKLLILLLLIPIFLPAKEMVKIGVIDMKKLTAELPEAKEMRESWDKFVNKKYYMEKIYELNNKYLKSDNVMSLSDISNRNLKGLFFKKILKNIDIEKKRYLKVLQLKRSRELRRKIFLALKQVRRKKGFGIVLSSKRKLIIFYDNIANLNPYLVEELVPKINKSK